MAKQRASRRKGGAGDRPVEIPMTDLGWSQGGDEEIEETGSAEDIHAAGTPGGGAASGGLGGTNAGEGEPDNADLEDALGSGVHDNEHEDIDQPPYSGSAGGAVGGTPAEKRARGGRRGAHFAPDEPHRGDSTIGSRPDRGGKRTRGGKKR